MDKVSLFRLLGWPDPFGVVLLSLFLILLLAPYFSGADFGLFKVPMFTEGAKKWLRIIGPIMFIVCAVSFVPIIPARPSVDGKTTMVDGTVPSSAPDYSQHKFIHDPKV